MTWTKGRGILGPLKPLLGEWVSVAAHGDSRAAQMRCSRTFSLFGKGWAQLDARWEVGPAKEYRETAFFGRGEDGALACFSFTSDGKRSLGHLADASDVASDAIAFEALMPAGLARMVYWPANDGRPGFHFAVETRTRNGWNRFLEQKFVPRI